jgi:hypothetical protein
MLAADLASELPANIAQPKREGAWPPQRPVHIILVLVQDALLAGPFQLGYGGALPNFTAS